MKLAVIISFIAIFSVVSAEPPSSGRGRKLSTKDDDFEPISTTEEPRSDEGGTEMPHYVWPDDNTNVNDWGDAVEPFGQCGGESHTGGTRCIEGWECKLVSSALSQCFPIGADISYYTNVAATPPVSLESVASSTLPTRMVLDDTTDAPLSETPSPGEPATAVPQTPEPPLNEVADPSPAPTTSRSNQPNFVSGWDQCGGKGFDYAKYTSESVDPDTTQLGCEPGYECKIVNEWYFQCIPKINDATKVELWGQCNGNGIPHEKACVEGAYCQFQSAHYSQCVPIGQRS